MTSNTSTATVAAATASATSLPLPAYTLNTRRSPYTLGTPNPFLYEASQLARALLIVFPRPSAPGPITEDQMLLIEHIICSVANFQYGSKLGPMPTDPSWAELERLSNDLVLLAHQCGLSLRNEYWTGRKIDLRGLYNRVVEKVLYDLLKRGHSPESIMGRLKLDERRLLRQLTLLKISKCFPRGRIRLGASASEAHRI